MYGNSQPMYGQPMYGQPMQPQYGQPMQPMYQQPPPPYMQPQQQTIIIQNENNNEGVPCQFCGTNTGQIVRRKMGIVACIWVVFLLPLYMCCLPCLMDGCKDQQLVCVKCNQVKKIIRANCC